MGNSLAACADVRLRLPAAVAVALVASSRMCVLPFCLPARLSTCNSHPVPLAVCVSVFLAFCSHLGRLHRRAQHAPLLSPAAVLESTWANSHLKPPLQFVMCPTTIRARTRGSESQQRPGLADMAPCVFELCRSRLLQGQTRTVDGESAPRNSRIKTGAGRRGEKGGSRGWAPTFRAQKLCVGKEGDLSKCAA